MSINPRVSIKTIVRDDEDRLSLSGAMAIAPYSYDKAGNNQNNNAVYNLLNNQLQQSALYTITYDVMGNIKTKYNKLNKTTSKYTFNARNQLTQYTQEDENNQTTKTLSYTYDTFGRRVSKTEDGVEQKYLYDGDAPQGHFLTSSGHIVAILDNDNQVIAAITHDESIDTPLSITNNNGTFYYHRDHQGSIIALTDSTGAVVESFTYDNHYGTITNHTKTVETNNPYAYTGRELDTPELYYYRARYYDPALQRFLGEDPIGFASWDFNFYRYVGNRSNMLVDPFGLLELCRTNGLLYHEFWMDNNSSIGFFPWDTDSIGAFSPSSNGTFQPVDSSRPKDTYSCVDFPANDCQTTCIMQYGTQHKAPKYNLYLNNCRDVARMIYIKCFIECHNK